METLHLHIGHGKTGSSFAQSALALSQDVLAQHGIAYPDLTDSFEAARHGRITSGNVHVNSRSVSAYVDQARPIIGGLPSLLFSNEYLFPYILKAEGQETIAALKDSGLRIRLLCFIRDPLDHAVSLYQQMVKRSGYTGDLRDYLPAYGGPGEVSRLINVCDRLGIELTISNYSRNHDRILPVFEEWLGLPADTLKRAPFSVVNRSMTAGELVLQREFNKHLGKRSSTLISDALCNQLPDIKSENPAIYRADLAPFLDRMRTMVRPVNARINESQVYNVPDIDAAIARFRDPDDPALVSFSAKQIEVLARRLSREIKENASKR